MSNDKKPASQATPETPVKYVIKTKGRSEIAANLAKICAIGDVGEKLIRGNWDQDSFAEVMAALAVKHLGKGRTAAQLGEIFRLVSCCNASAARQAAVAGFLLYGTPLNKVDKENKEQEITLETFWATYAPEAETKPNTSLLD